MNVQYHLQGVEFEWDEDKAQANGLVTRGSSMKNPEQDQPELRIRPREAETVSLKVPSDALASLDRVAAHRDMSREALLKLYGGQCLRQDLSKQ